MTTPKYIYFATTREVRRYEIEKETPKRFYIKGAYTSQVNKADVAPGRSWTLSLQAALERTKDRSWDNMEHHAQQVNEFRLANRNTTAALAAVSGRSDDALFALYKSL